VNNEPVSITADSGPSFKNTLSAGDRNTLALAFFFASLDHDDQIESKIMVIDDPMTSLDEGRIHATIQHIKRLSDKVEQTIILSHSKPFLLQFWDSSKAQNKSPFKIFRQGKCSSISRWDIAQDSITEHDKRYELILNFLKNGHAENDREVAIALRPSLEAFLRVSYSTHFRPGEMLGSFALKCEKTLKTAEPILDSSDLNELRHITDYANLFHHDTNSSGYTTARLNEAELTNYAQRTLAFIRK
jgi:wobble nucleotide-excising tRNase